MEWPKSPAAQVQVEKRPKGQAGGPDAQRAGGEVRAHGGTEAGWALSRKPQQHQVENQQKRPRRRKRWPRLLTADHDELEGPLDLTTRRLHRPD